MSIVSGIEHELFDRKSIERTNSNFYVLSPDVFNSNACFGAYGAANLIGGEHRVYWYDNEEDAQINVFQFTTDLGRGGMNQFLVHHPWGPSGTAVTGTVSSISTGLNLQSDFRDYRIRITEGPAAGDERVIAKNGVGTLNSNTSGVIYVTHPFSEAITNQSRFLLYTGSIYYIGTRDQWSFNKLDIATMTQTRLFSQTGRPFVNSDFEDNLFESERPPINPYGYNNGFTCPDPFRYYFSSTATSATVSSLTTSGKNWVTNNLRRFDIRIISGTGKGQSRIILSSTSDTVVVTPNWNIVPDSTSQYTIQPDPRLVYITGAGSYASENHTFNVETLKFAKTNITQGTYGNIIYADREQENSSYFVIFFSDDPDWNIETDLQVGKYLYYNYYGYLTIPRGVYRVRLYQTSSYQSYPTNVSLSRSTTFSNQRIFNFWDNSKTLYTVSRTTTTYSDLFKININLNPFSFEYAPFLSNTNLGGFTVGDALNPNLIILTSTDVDGKKYRYLHTRGYRVLLPEES